MAGWKDIREIVAWQYARDLKLRVDVFLERPAVKRQLKLHDQLFDAVRSGPRNIAEGFGKFGNKEFARFARIAPKRPQKPAAPPDSPKPASDPPEEPPEPESL